MQFLLNNYDKDHTDADGVTVYIGPQRQRILRVDLQAGRAVLRSHGYEIVFLRNDAGQWVPERNNWALCACVLGAPGLASAAFGF